MKMTESQLTHYRYLRACGYGARDAKARAIAWTAGGNKPLSRDALSAWIGAPDSDGARWIANPERAGLRFVGFADQLASLRHFGWYCRADDFGETYRGAVYQLTARKGRARYVPAYREGETGRGGNWRTWHDSSGDPAARLAFGDVIEGERLDSSWDDDSGARDAAKRADSIAEIAADKAREYDSAWQAGRAFAEHMESAQAARAQARELIGDIRRARGDAGFCERFPSIGKALRSAIRDALETWQGERAKACELWDEYALTHHSFARNDRARGLAESFIEGAQS